MSKKDFIKKLGRALGALPKDERRKTLDYYSELIDDRVESGAAEEDAVSAMGDIGVIAEDILSDAKERGVDLKKKKSPALWIVLSILLILVSVSALFFGGVAVFRYVLGYELPESNVEWNEVKAVYDISETGSISVKLGYYDLFIGQSDDEKIHVTYYECDRIKFEVNSTETEFSLVQRGKLAWTLFSQNKTKQAIVMIPAGFAGSVDAAGSTGDTRVDSISSPVTLSVNGTTGDMTIYDLRVREASFSHSTGLLHLGRCNVEGKLTIKGTTGDMEIGQVSAGDMEVSASTGDLEITQITTGEMNVTATTGDVRLEDITAVSIEVGLSTGAMRFTTVTADAAYFHMTTGSVSFDRLDAKDIRINATTGSVRGMLAGSIVDYTVESRVSTGKNSLPESFGNGERKLVVKTGTGDIELRFEKNS